MNVDAEILRLRDRIHSLSNKIQALTFQQELTEEWKKQMISTIGELAEAVGKITKADELADAVAAKIDAEHTVRLTLIQKVIVGGAGLAAIADFALRLAGKA